MPLRRVLSFLAFALIASPAVAAAQNTGIIRGRINDAATGAPLAGVQVRVEGAAAGVVRVRRGAIMGLSKGSGPTCVRLVRFSV